MGIKLKKQTALQTQANVIGALFRREISTRFGQYKLGLLWLVLEPLVSVILLGLILGPLVGRSTSSDTPYAFFILCGVMMLRMLTGPVNASMGAISANRGLLVFRQLQPLDPFIARFIFEFATTILSFGLFCLIGIAFGINLSGEQIITLVWCFCITWAMGCGWGLLAGINVLKYKELDKINSLIQRPLLFCSCVFYSLDSMPYEIRQWLLLNPLVHTIELSRQALFFNYIPTEVNLVFPTLFALSLLALGMVSYRNNLHYLTQR